MIVKTDLWIEELSFYHQQQLFILVISSDTDDCYPNPCFNKATCRDEVNNYTCACGAGFEGRHCDNSKFYC